MIRSKYIASTVVTGTANSSSAFQYERRELCTFIFLLTWLLHFVKYINITLGNCDGAVHASLMIKDTTSRMG